MNLKDAHRKLGSLSTAEIVHELQQNFVEYHELYNEKRQKWDVIPAEYVAEEIFKQHIGDHSTSIKIVDFGCGDEGLFEAELLEMLKSRSSSLEPVVVEVLALDVVALASAAQLEFQSPNLHFTCITKGCNYSDIKVMGQYDVGVFCLSMMATDALETGLLQAVRLVKPGNVIIIVQVVEK